MFDELNKVYQQVNPGFNPAPGLGTPQGFSGFVANLMIAIAISMSFIMMAWAFVQFLLTQGDPKNIQKAHRALWYSIVALLVSALAVAIKSAFFRSIGLGTGSGVTTYTI